MIRKKITRSIKDSMVKLYKKGLGTVRISKKLGISRTAVRNNLLKMDIRFRKASKDIVEGNLHRKFIELYKKGLSIKQIAQICSVSFSAVQRRLHKEDIDLKKRGNPAKILNNKYYKLTSEKAYILSVVGPGDGFIEYNRNNGQYRVVLEATDQDFINYFVFCLEKTYGIKSKIKKIAPRNFGINPTFITRLGSKEVCDDLLNYKVSFKEREWRVPKIIKDVSKEIKCKYIQGFADSQGCVAYYPTQKSIILSSKNVSGLKGIKNLLKDLNIRANKIKSGLGITGKENLDNFNKNISFNIDRKKNKLQELINSYKKFEWRRK